ncbi:MAG: cysteine peptidase family C39 domain-containing protein [Candidatus Woesearchaeota archaeon]
MKLDVPLVLQAQGSQDCGIAGLSMILKYYDINKDIEEIKKDMHYDGKFYYIPQLGTYLINQGFNVELITQHPGLFTLQDKNLTISELDARFELLKNNSKNLQEKKVLEYFIEFINAGGSIKIKIPDETDIEKELLERRPLGAALTTNFMYQKTKKISFNSHFQIITGIDETYVHVNDPIPDETGGRQKFHKKDFFYGLYASAYADLDNASLMIIKRL